MDLTDNDFQLKLFAGWLITSEFRMHLNQSVLWKRENDLDDPSRLVTTKFENKDYIGFRLEKEFTTRPELEHVHKSIQDKVSAYCPDYKFERQKLFTFPIILVG